jgi:hypothetical protein
VGIIRHLTLTGLFDQRGETEIGKCLLDQGSDLTLVKTTADMNRTGLKVIAGSERAACRDRDRFRSDGVEWWGLGP